MTKPYTLCIPTYRRQGEVETLLKSIPGDVPIVISDNEQYLHGDIQIAQRARLVGQAGPVLPPFQNWNNAVRGSSSTYILIPSDDDIYYPNTFEVIDRCLTRYPERDLYVFGHNLVDENYQVIGQWLPTRTTDYSPGQGFFEFTYGVDCRMPSVLIRREAFERAGGFDESMSATAGDSQLIQIILLSGTSVFVSEIISGYRIWAKSSTNLTNASDQWFSECHRWCDNVKRVATNLYGTSFLPKDFKTRILYRNYRSAFATTRRNSGIVAASRFALRSAYREVMHSAGS